MTAPKANLVENKPCPTLLPIDIIAELLIPAYLEGVTKYERESWRRGFYISTMIDAAQRHINAFFYEGQDIDPDSSTGKHHLGGAIFSLLSAYHSIKYHQHLDDRRDPATGDLLFDVGKSEVKKIDPLVCPYDQTTRCQVADPCVSCEVLKRLNK